MIYVHPVGGLGNMLFHIAAIWSLAKDNDDELCLLNIEGKINELLNDKRGCELKHAAIYKYLFNRFPNKDGSADSSLKYPFHYVPLEYKNGCEYIGHFQTERYFKHRRGEILELFKPADEFNERIDSHSHLFGNISLHVRRKEYVGSGIFDVVKMDYYQKALSVLPEDLQILIFSDDLNWCRHNFVGERYVFIDEMDYISIYLMAKMKHNIIVNSSFSWWGAWLSECQDKIVVAPKVWFGNNHADASNVVLDEWVKI